MDIYDYLKKDHEKVARFFKEFENTQDAEYQLEIFNMINKELLIHAVSEQETFYKALEQYKESIDITSHGEEEHAEIEAKLDELSNVVKPNAAWAKKVLELKELVEHHVSEEEGKMFREAKKVLSDEDALVIKEQMHDFKDRIKEELGE